LCSLHWRSYDLAKITTKKPPSSEYEKGGYRNNKQRKIKES